jgi:phosphatidylserine decarboxylase
MAVALASKWQLGVLRGLAFAVSTTAAAGAAALIVDSGVGATTAWTAASTWLFACLVGLSLLLYRFYRDPERQPPSAGDAVVSPADGTILYVHSVTNGMLPVVTKNGKGHTLEELTKTPLHLEDATIVGIGLNFLDVHVNRAPMSGCITTLHHHPGRFGSLRDIEMIFENERVTLVIENEGFQVAAVLIASRLVRRIALFVGKDQSVVIGQRIGMIRFGSQVDVVLPATARIVETLAVGQKVLAGESILARLDLTSPTAKPCRDREAPTEQL